LSTRPQCHGFLCGAADNAFSEVPKSFTFKARLVHRVYQKQSTLIQWYVLLMAVTMQAQRETPPDMQCKDKFLVQSVVAPPGSSTKEVSQDLVRVLYGWFCTKVMLFADLILDFCLIISSPLHLRAAVVTLYLSF
jgi:hypothetical protein